MKIGGPFSNNLKGSSMTEGNPYSLLICFSMPLVLGNLFQQLYTFVDTVIVGQKLGMHALAALGATEWLCFLMFGFIQGMTQGLSINVSKYFGEGNRERLQQAIFHAGLASFGAAIVFSVAGQMMLVPLLRLLRTPDELFAMSWLYLHLLYLGIPVAFVYNMAAAILRAFGNSKAPLCAIVLASVCNIALDAVLVLALDMGIRGAAYGTLLSQACAGAYCLIELRRSGLAKVDGENRAWRREMFMEQIRISVPMGFQSVITAIGGLAVQSVANGFGVLFLAGYTAANKLYGLLEIAASSYGYGISTYTAQNIGAKKLERLRAGIIAALRTGIATAAIMSFIMFVFGKPVLALFLQKSQAESGAAMAIGYQFLCILGVFFPLLYILYIIRACIQGMGNSFMPMLSSLLQVLMRLLCAFGATRIIGDTGIFWGEIMAWIGADIFLAVVLKRLFRGQLA